MNEPSAITFSEKTLSNQILFVQSYIFINAYKKGKGQRPTTLFEDAAAM